MARVTLMAEQMAILKVRLTDLDGNTEGSSDRLGWQR
jgi:hypothetical protein